jgi:hypothetical protein
MYASRKDSEFGKSPIASSQAALTADISDE